MPRSELDSLQATLNSAIDTIRQELSTAAYPDLSSLSIEPHPLDDPAQVPSRNLFEAQSTAIGENFLFPSYCCCSLIPSLSSSCPCVFCLFLRPTVQELNLCRRPVSKFSSRAPTSAPRSKYSPSTTPPVSTSSSGSASLTSYQTPQTHVVDFTSKSCRRNSMSTNRRLQSSSVFLQQRAGSTRRARACSPSLDPHFS